MLVEFVVSLFAVCGNHWKMLMLVKVGLANFSQMFGAEIPLILSVSEQDSGQRTVGTLLIINWFLRFLNF